MPPRALYRFHGLPTTHQLLVLSALLDPLGSALGYLLAPFVGAEPVLGAAIGLIVASLVVSAWFSTGRT